MYKPFNLKLSDNDFSEYITVGKEIHKKNKKLTSKVFDYFEDIKDVLVADKIMKDWFPKTNSHVFLSHSHKDEDLVIGLSGYLYNKFGLDSFIDSCIWGSSDDLLRAIDDKYCQSGDYYSYSKRNRSTSHVHIMLSSAIARMIDNTECIIFVNTPNSISTENYIRSQTYSPWIYLEILTTTIVEKRIPERIAIEKGSFRADSASATESLLPIKYDLYLDHLINISEEKLNDWHLECNGKKGVEALDCLYGLVNSRS